MGVNTSMYQSFCQTNQQLSNHQTKLLNITYIHTSVTLVFHALASQWPACGDQIPKRPNTVIRQSKCSKLAITIKPNFATASLFNKCTTRNAHIDAVHDCELLIQMYVCMYVQGGQHQLFSDTQCRSETGDASKKSSETSVLD